MSTLALAWVIVILDQITKIWMQAHLPLGQTWQVIPGFFNLTHVRNTGAVWGILQQQNAWLVVFSLGALIMLGLFRRWLLHVQGIHRLVLGLLLGGVLGNLIDRVKLGWVVDFFDFHFAGRHWPAFNVADAAICVGVAGYIWLTWRDMRRTEVPAS
ncbi:MAG: signal peptidase II [Kiritimatiellia bacterium]|nr:signal peptidase II [Lentisphaerota bacterium]